MKQFQQMNQTVRIQMRMMLELELDYWDKNQRTNDDEAAKQESQTVLWHNFEKRLCNMMKHPVSDVGKRAEKPGAVGAMPDVLAPLFDKPLSDEEWKIVDSLTKFLAIFKSATEVLSG